MQPIFAEKRPLSPIGRLICTQPTPGPQPNGSKIQYPISPATFLPQLYRPQLAKFQSFN